MLMPLNPAGQDRHHPCFFARDKGKFGRIHLPVARSCNIQCAYCRRDYDCAHENRPGVSHGVISPEAALDRLTRTLEAHPHICVAGIAGPGDAFCHPESTLKTFELIRQRFPKISFCVSSNGLNLAPHVQALRDLGVGFTTVTVNALDPEIGEQMVNAVRLGNRVYTGQAASRVLIERQMDAVEALKAQGITVKVNTVVVPGINDGHCLFVAKRMGAMGVDLMNLLPLIPVSGTDMAHRREPSSELILRLRKAAGVYIPQMHHCRRCRADAVGCL